MNEYRLTTTTNHEGRNLGIKMMTLLSSSYLWKSFLTLFSTCLIAVSLFIGYHRIFSFFLRRRRRDATSGIRIAFFHPYCTGGGGGERVLWKMMQVLGNLMDRGLRIHPTVIIYTIDDPTPSYSQGPCHRRFDQ
jgi:ALG11 mannosyltransferase N-terminus